MKSGDPEKGRQASASCAGCHGAEGTSPNPVFPHTAGQEPAYAYEQLKDYKDRTRANECVNRRSLWSNRRFTQSSMRGVVPGFR